MSSKHFWSSQPWICKAPNFSLRFRGPVSEMRFRCNSTVPSKIVQMIESGRSLLPLVTSNFFPVPTEEGLTESSRFVFDASAQTMLTSGTSVPLSSQLGGPLLDDCWLNLKLSVHVDVPSYVKLTFFVALSQTASGATTSSQEMKSSV